MHCEKVFFLRIVVIYLEKYPKIKNNFYLCSKQVKYCMVLIQNQKRFCPICNKPHLGFGMILRVAQSYVG